MPRASAIALVLTSSTAAFTLAWAASSWLRPRPPLEPIQESAARGDLDEARRQALAYLRDYPEDSGAAILLAQLDLERLDRLERPDPALALEVVEHLRRTRTEDKALASASKLYEGMACWHLRRFDEAEAAWKEAIRIDSAAEKPGRMLLDLYELQGRSEEFRALGERLASLQVGPRERVRVLLELVRNDVHRRAAIDAIERLRPVVRDHPGDLQSALALGRALVREGRIDEGLEILGREVRGHPDDPNAWDSWLSGLSESGRIDDLARELAHIPTAFASSPRVARHEGRVAQERGDWKAALRSYRRALQADPLDTRLEYRLSRVLRNAGELADATRLDRRFRDREAARKALRELYEKNGLEHWDGTSDPALFRQIADLRERMGLADQARAWHGLVLQANPEDRTSLAALARLGSGHTGSTTGPTAESRGPGEPVP